jgi:PAS domain S-box-containing protein
MPGWHDYRSLWELMNATLQKNSDVHIVVSACQNFRHSPSKPNGANNGHVMPAENIIMGTTKEISTSKLEERKQLEAELVVERRFLRALLDNLPDAIYFKDNQSHFIKASKALANQLEANSPEELVGKSDFDFFLKAHAQPAFDDEQEIIRTGKPLVGKVEKEILRDGKESWALTSKMPLRNEAGEIIGTFGVSKDITAIKAAEAKLDQVHKQLLATSRQAGMAEVATSVLHNVGNVLNSINVSSALIRDKIQNSRMPNLAKAVALLQMPEDRLADFFAHDPKGKQLPAYLANLATHLAQEQKEIVEEFESLVSHVEHIKEVVALQQNYARISGVAEMVSAADLMEDALRINLGAMERHRIELVRNYSETPPVSIEKHKVLQILVNLIRNAKYACDDSGRQDKRIILTVTQENGRIKMSVSDNGIGIPAENLSRIFNHGFTTRKDGHGFGLHSGALAAKEIGGSLTVVSEGPGRGATFTIELPVNS